MDNTKSAGRVTRTKGKAVSGDEAEVSVAEPEMAPNLNGNKDTSVEAEAKPTVDPENVFVLAEDAESTKEELRGTRKRKLTDMKGDEEETFVIKEENDIDIKDEPSTESKTDDNASLEEANNSLNSSMDTSDANSSTETAAVSKSKSVGHNTITSVDTTYGKGKRARVPNKRYSDIIRTTSRTPKSDNIPTSRIPKTPTGSAKNGEFPDDDLGEILREESELNAKVSAVPASRKSTAGIKKIRSSVDLTDPAFRKPFKFGWRRELVIRSTSTEGNRIGDIYYYNASGQKFRSMREVQHHLVKNRDLALENFTFFKEPLGLNDTNKEIIRDAKRGPGMTKVMSSNRKLASKLIMKTKKRAKTPTVATTPPTPSPPKSAKITKQSSFKVKAPVKPPSTKKDKKEVEDEAPAPVWNKKGKANVDKKPCQPCSIRCEGLQGLVPCLQCRICLCLYHNECVGIASQVKVQNYVCKNCQLEQEPSDGSTGTKAALNIPQTNPPFPHADRNSGNAPTDRFNSDTNSKNVSPHAKLNLNNNNTEQKSLVGSLTTWFPQSSTIQVSNNESDSLTKVPPRPQLVEFIGNKKYVVVPRHNILSVRSPGQAATALINSAFNAPQPEPNIACENPSSSESSALPQPLSETPNQEDAKDEAFTPTTAVDEKAPELVKTISKPSTRIKSTSEDTSVSRPGPPNFMNLYMQNLQYGYTTLFGVFQYLKVQDLLRAGCVCTMWRDMSRYPALWRTVRMKNSQIHSFEGMANALREHGTVHLDMRKMLLPSKGDDDIWPSFINAIKKVESLRRIELCRCLASVVEDLARNNHKLEVINAVTIKCDGMTFEPFENLTNLTDLRLKSNAGLTLSSDLSALKSLTKLKHLSITSIKDLNKLNIEVISELVNLEVLDLGECTDFPEYFGRDILSKLTNLEKLRLEKGQGDCHTFDILDAVKGLPGLQQLELVNFDIKAGFDKSLGGCSNIKKLLIIPTYISQSATTNHMILGGALRLQKTLAHFVWGVTLELLRVTQLFVSQQSNDQPSKKDDKDANNESIPVLKPVPLTGLTQTEVSESLKETQVEILPLSNLKNLLLQNLPTTRVKIVKIPFHSTWRQSITDSGN